MASRRALFPGEADASDVGPWTTVSKSSGLAAARRSRLAPPAWRGTRPSMRSRRRAPPGPDQEKSPFLPNVGEARGQEARLLSACLSTTAGSDPSGRPWRACTRCQWLSSVRMEGAVSRFRLAFVDGGQFWPPLRHGDGLDSAGRCRVLIFVGRSQARPGRSPGASGGFDREPERLRADGRRSAAVGDNDRRGPDQGCAVPSGGTTSHLIDRLPVLNRSPGIPVSGQSGISEPLHGGAPRETTPVHEAGFHPPGGKVI